MCRADHYYSDLKTINDIICSEMMKSLSSLLSRLFMSPLKNNSKVIAREGEPDIVRIEGEDSEMNTAIEKANQTFSQFDSALSSKDTSLISWAIKVRFDTPDGNGEHIWLTDITKRGDQFYGVIANMPNLTTEVKLGDTVKIPTAKISDWRYIQNGKLKGGYTIRVLRNRLSKDQRKALDEQSGYTVD